ncbi:MAG: hypothetical protein ACXWRA_06690 [Pseudobdellovibrionaceae bacterium]
MEISFAEIRAFSSRYLIFTDESGSDRFWYLRLETAAGIYIIWTGYLRNRVEIENIFREVINRALV